MKLLKNNFKLLILIIILIINRVNSFNMVTLLAAHVQDLGFNNMVNEGRIAVDKELKLENSRTYVVGGYNQTRDLLLPIIQNEDIDFVICSSQDHLQACREIANMYLGDPVIKTQFLVRGSLQSTKNLIYYSYNYASSNYISGAFAGLYTKTNKIGFISPGAIINNNDSFVYSFWLGAKQANPNIEFYYYNVGAYLAPDKTVAAAQDLISKYGCDVVADTLNDFSTGETVIANKLHAIGTNGFPQRSVYGEEVAYSYSYDWAKLFIPIAKSVQAGNTNNSVWYGDFNKDPNLNFFTLDYSFQVDSSTIQKVNQILDGLKNTERLTHPYFCNDMMGEYATKYGLSLSSPNCLSGNAFLRINEPFPGMTYLGNYEIQLKKVEFNKSVERAISIISSIFIAFVLLMIIGIRRYSHTPSMRSASPFFLYIILFGAIMVYVGIILWVSQISTSSCNAKFWLVTLGFSTLISCLVVKNFRIWLIFDNPELRSIKITNYDLLPYVGACLLVNVILMSFLTASIGGDLKQISAQGIDSLGKYEYMNVCKMNSTGASILYTILAYFAALLLVGVFVSFKLKIVEIQEFDESKVIANTLYAISFCLFVIVPLMISPQEKQSETIILAVSGLFIVTAAILIIFIPKFYRVFKFGSSGTNEMFNKSRSKSPVATARSSKSSSGGAAGNSNSGRAKTNRRGNIMDGDFSDTESSISEKVLKVDQGAVLANFTDDTISEVDSNTDDFKENNNNNNNNNVQIQENQIIVNNNNNLEEVKEDEDEKVNVVVGDDDTDDGDDENSVEL